jgi:hypothetical protein
MKRLFIICLTGLIVISAKAQTSSSTDNIDSLQIRNTIFDFYTWYSKYHMRLNSFELYRGIKKKDEPPYKIDWVEAEKYFAYIRSSVPQLGEAFIKNQRAFLKECDSAFKKDTEGEVPYGFDYDWYTNSQEDTPYILEELNNAEKWIVSVRGSTAIVELHNKQGSGSEKTHAFICYSMNKEKGKWKIGRIGCMSPENEPPPQMQ